MKKYLVIPLLLALTSCASTQIQTVYRYSERPVPVEPQTQPVNMRDVQWKVLTKTELAAIVKEQEANPDPNFALFALTPKGFEALSSNLVDINRFMQEQNEVIEYYRAYTRETAKPVAVPTPKPKA